MTIPIEIRQAVYAALKSVCPRVWFKRAPEQREYPYLVYDLPNSHDDGSLEQYTLDVDGWDRPDDGDSTRLEQLMDAADKALLTVTVVTSNVRFRIVRENRLAPEEDDPRLIRRWYIYQIRVYERRR